MTPEKLEETVIETKGAVDALEERVEQLEGTLKAVFETVQAWEKRTGKKIFKKGEYLGFNFN